MKEIKAIIKKVLFEEFDERLNVNRLLIPITKNPNFPNQFQNSFTCEYVNMFVSFFYVAVQHI